MRVAFSEIVKGSVQSKKKERLISPPIRPLSSPFTLLRGTHLSRRLHTSYLVIVVVIVAVVVVLACVGFALLCLVGGRSVLFVLLEGRFDRVGRGRCPIIQRVHRLTCFHRRHNINKDKDNGNRLLLLLRKNGLRSRLLLRRGDVL